MAASQMREPHMTLTNDNSNARSTKAVAALQGLLRQSRAKSADARVAARTLARTSKDRAVVGSRVALGAAKKRPVSTGLLVVGAVAGGALLLNPALRRLAIANAPALWRFVRSRTDAARSAVSDRI